MSIIYENKKVLVMVIVIFLMTFASSGYASISKLEEQVLVVENNILVMQGQKDFALGTFRETLVDDSGCITLANGDGDILSSGMYISPVITSLPFTELVISWNADTPIGTKVAIEAQVRVDGTWSPWFSWGTWCSWEQAGSSNMHMKSSVAQMNIDTLVLNKGKVATALRYRVNLNSNQANLTPRIKLVATAVNAASTPLANLEKQDIVLDVPQYAQRGRDSRIAGTICSPVSMTMLLNYYGIWVIPEETARNVMDNSQNIAAYGNWPFNCAYAATFGLRSYVAYYSSLEDIRKDLIEGRPVAASVIYKNSEEVEEDLPVLHNAPVEATDGHLVVVRGLIKKDGKEYVVVNDPAAKDNRSVRRLYLRDEFEKAWTKIVYVVEKDKNAILTQPKRIAAKLGKERHKLSIEYAGGTIDFAAEDIGSIVKLKSNQTVEFLPPETTNSVIEKEEKGTKILIITKNHQVFEITMESDEY